MSVLFLYLPLPIFWALFDQQGSRWTLQAIRMNGQLGGFMIKPDQIQVVNPILVLLMVPLFEYCIYPLFKKIGIDRPLQRMTIGGVLAGISFLICGFMQLQLEKEEPIKQLSDHNHIAVVNSFTNCDVHFMNETISPLMSKYWPNLNRSILNTFDQQVILQSANGSSTCAEGTFQVKQSFTLNNEESLILVATNKIYLTNTLDWIIDKNILRKPNEGGALLFTVFNLENYNGQPFNVTQTNSELKWNYTTTSDVAFGKVSEFEVEITGKAVTMSVGNEDNRKYQDLTLDQGAAYIQLISGNMNDVSNSPVIRINYIYNIKIN